MQKFLMNSLALIILSNSYRIMTMNLFQLRTSINWMIRITTAVILIIKGFMFIRQICFLRYSSHQYCLIHRATSFCKDQGWLERLLFFTFYSMIIHRSSRFTSTFQSQLQTTQSSNSWELIHWRPLRSMLWWIVTNDTFSFSRTSPHKIWEQLRSSEC